MDSKPEFIQALQELGMTRTEAQVYLATLQTSTEGPVSGYKVAQVMGRDPANLSKTLAHLVKLGAVRLVQARPRHYQAVPVAEFSELVLDRMEGFRERVVSLMEGLGSNAMLQQPMPLGKAAQIMARTESILQQSKGRLILGCDDETLDQLQHTLEELGRSFPETAKIITETHREIPGVKSFVSNGLSSMVPPLTEGKGKNWLVLATDTGHWLSAVFKFGQTGPVTSGWAGSNLEISAPFKIVLDALCADVQTKQDQVEILQKQFWQASQVPPVDSESEPAEPNLGQEAFEPGTIAHVAGNFSKDSATPTPDRPAPNLESNTGKEGIVILPKDEHFPQAGSSAWSENSPTEEKLKFLVKHEEKQDIEDGLGET